MIEHTDNTVTDNRNSQSNRPGSGTRFHGSACLAGMMLCVLSMTGDLQGDEKSRAAGRVRLLMPPSIPAVAGLECSLYFNNVVLVPRLDILIVDVTCPKGRQQTERWTWTPTDADVGEHPLQIDIRDDANQVIASASTVVRVVAAAQAADRPLSLLCIGDSLTHASVYTQRLLDLCSSPPNPRLTLVGTHWPGDERGPNRHEGYGGWTARRFATHFTETARTGSYRERGSPFLYRRDDGTQTLDFTRYLQEVHPGQTLDAATIFLGPNDIFSFNDETIEGGIEDMLTHMDLLLEMIRRDSPTTQIGLMLPVPPAASQDSFGSNYASGQTRWQYQRNQHLLVERMLDRYASEGALKKYESRVHIIPTYVGLDCEHNYPAESVVVNARSDMTVLRQNNGVHPSSSGYAQIGDIVYAWLKSLPVPAP